MLKNVTHTGALLEDHHWRCQMFGIWYVPGLSDAVLEERKNNPGSLTLDELKVIAETFHLNKENVEELVNSYLSPDPYYSSDEARDEYTNWEKNFFLSRRKKR